MNGGINVYLLENNAMRYGLNEQGQVVSVYNKHSCHEYVYMPGELWKLIYAEGERTEIPVCSTGQKFSCTQESNRMTLTYENLKGDGRTLAVALTLIFEMDEDSLSVRAVIDNHDTARVMELVVTAVSGVRSLSGKPQNDAIAWPLRMGLRVPNPAYNDLSTYSGFRKYERHDQFHTDLDNLYPAPLSMQWYDWYNESEGLYVGSHDTTHHTLCLHVERDVKCNILRMGLCRYPMLEPGESWESAPIVYAPHLGDWHAGAARYRRFMEQSGNWKAPSQPEWVRHFKGWLRVILKQHHMECNWTYDDIPRLFDETQAAGMDTLFLLGWEKGGFARMWPDYVADERMGGEEKLRAGIDYVHQKGGKVILFLSYSLVDHKSEYYRNGPGRQVTIKSLWDEEVTFSETYCGEGTYRKLPNPPMPMSLACPGSDLWQEKMLSSADVCMNLGADGVLYDLGGLKPYFCFDRTHNHAKPSHSCEQKAARFEELHGHIHHEKAENAILMEHAVDIFNQHMDIVHSSRIVSQTDDLSAMYRYTFPELVMTNRECGEDENDYLWKAGFSFLYGLRFDMTIYRCCGTLSDIPNYAAYLKTINTLRERYANTLLRGRFIDEDGIAWDQPQVRVKAFAAEDGEIGCALWNPTKEDVPVTVTFANGASATVFVPAERVAALSSRDAARES